MILVNQSKIQQENKKQDVLDKIRLENEDFDIQQRFKNKNIIEVEQENNQKAEELFQLEDLLEKNKENQEKERVLTKRKLLDFVRKNEAHQSNIAIQQK